MALSTKQGTFTIPASAATDTVVSSLGFTPKAIIFYGADQTADGYGANARFFVGFTVGTSAVQNFYAYTSAGDAVSTTSSANNNSTGSCIDSLSGSAFGVLKSFDSGGFTIDWTQVLAAAIGVIVHYLAIGGSDLDSAEINVWDQPAVTGQFTVSTTFKPDCIFVAGSSWPSASNGHTLMLGAAVNPAARWAYGSDSRDAATMTGLVDADRSQRTDSLIEMRSLTSEAQRGDLVSFNPTSVVINYSVAQNGSNGRCAMLCLKGGTYAVGAAAKPTGAATVNQDITVGFPVTGLLLSSWNSAASTSAVIDEKLSFGTSDGTNESAIWHHYKDATLPTVAKSSQISTKALRLATAASTTDAECDSSFTAVTNGIRLAWTTNNAVAAEICYLAMGNTIPNSIDGNRVSWPDYLNNNVGPFSNGNNLYSVFVDKIANKLRCYKSTDSGTTWAVQDYVNSPASSSTTNFKSAHCQLSGTVLYCFKPISASSMTIEQFDTSTDTWGTQIAGPTINLTIGNLVAIPLSGVRRSDGSFAIFYNDGNLIKLQYRTAAGTWNGPFDVQGSLNSPLSNTAPGGTDSYRSRAAFLGTNDRVHLFYGVSNAGVSTFRSRCFTSGNVFTSVQDVDATTVSAAGYITLPTMNGSEIVGAYVDLNAGLQAFRATDADSPSWSVSQAISATSVSNPEFINANPGALVANGGIMYAFWPDDTSQNIYDDSDKAGGLWGTDVLWKAITCNGLSAGAVSGAVNGRVGVLYNEQIAANFVFPKYDFLAFPYAGYGRPDGMSGFRQLLQILAQ